MEYVSLRSCFYFWKGLVFKKFSSTFGASIASRQYYSRLVNVANWDTTPVFLKATGDVSQPVWSPVFISSVLALFEKNMMSSVKKFFNRSYAQFASITVTTIAVNYRELTKRLSAS